MSREIRRMKTMREALQSLADAAGQYVFESAESDDLRRQELRNRLVEAEDAARDVLLNGEGACAVAAPPEHRRIQIVVEYLDGTARYFPVPPGEGWKVDVAQRCLVIGRCVGRQIVPLDNVASFSPEEFSEVAS